MKILVTLDGSTFSEAILPAAAQIARAAGAEVHLLSVVEEPSVRRSWVEAIAMGEAGAGELMLPPGAMPRYPDAGPSAEADAQTLEQAISSVEQYLAEAALRFPAGAIPKAIAGHDPVAAITEYSKEHGIDLIAMSTHGRSGLGRWVYGSNADKLLQSTTIPMLLIRPQGGDASAQGEMPINTLVVPLDGSEFAEESLSYAESLASQMSIRLSLIRVITTPAIAYPGTETYAYDPRLFTDLENDGFSLHAGPAGTAGIEGAGGLLHGEGGLPGRTHNRLRRRKRGQPHRDVHAWSFRHWPVDNGKRGRPRAQGGLQTHPADPLGGHGRLTARAAEAGAS